MANSDKNIKITPNISQTAQPNVVFTGQGNVPITLKVLDDSYGTLSFEGSAGQLFSINNNLTSGVIFAVNDVSGIPQIDVNANGTIRIGPFGGQVGIGISTPIATGLTINRLSTDAGTGQLMISNPNNTNVRFNLGYHTTTNYAFINAYTSSLSSQPLILQEHFDGRVGLGAVTSPDAKLDIRIGTATTKGLLVKGFTSQSARIFEFQNSAGTVLTNIDSSGNLTVATTASAYTYYSVNTTTRWAVGHDSGNGYFRIVDYVWDGTTRLMITPGGNVVLGNSGGDQTTGPKLLVTTGPDTTGGTGAARKGIIVRGSTSQTANLQEWQNSGGTQLATVDSGGLAYFNSFGIYDYTRSGGNTGYYTHYCVFRDIPDTVGNYVEIGDLATARLWEVEVLAWRSSYDPTYGTQYNTVVKRYTVETRYLTAGILVPDAVANPFTTFNDYEVELVNDGNGIATRLRIRRTAAVSGVSTGFQAMIKIVGATTYPNTAGFSPLSGTGTSALALSYRGLEPRLFSTITPPKPAGNSGAGLNLTLQAGSGVTSGAGGSIILQPGTQATTGGNGNVKVYGGVLAIRNEARTSEFVAFTSSSVASGSTTDLTVSGIGASIYSITFSVSNVVYTTNAFGLNSGNYCLYGSGGVRLAGGSILFGTGATYQNTDSVGLVQGGVGVIRVADSTTGYSLGSGGGSFAFTSSSPTAYAADQNNLVLTGSAFQRLSASGANRTITGIAPPTGGSHVDGRMMRIYNIGTTYSLILAHNSTSSTTTNRLWCVGQGNITIAPYDYAELIYDNTDNGRGGAGWRVH